MKRESIEDERIYIERRRVNIEVAAAAIWPEIPEEERKARVREALKDRFCEWSLDLQRVTAKILEARGV